MWDFISAKIMEAIGPYQTKIVASIAVGRSWNFPDYDRKIYIMGIKLNKTFTILERR